MDFSLVGLDEYIVDRIKWFAKDLYHVLEQGDFLIFYNMQVDMQGIHDLGKSEIYNRGYFILDDSKGGKLIISRRH